MLACAAENDVLTSCVTSGIELYRIIKTLHDHGTSITISIDGIRHASIRGGKQLTNQLPIMNFFAPRDYLTVLKTYLEHFPDAPVTVTTLIRPEMKEQILKLPALLADIGVKSWAGTPEVIPATDETPSHFKHLPEKVYELAHEMDAAAKRHGQPGLLLMDELGAMTRGASPADLHVFTLARPEWLIRIDRVTHQVAIGPKQVASMGPEVPLWEYQRESLFDHITRRLGDTMPAPRAKLAA